MTAKSRKNRTVALPLICLVAAMLGLAFASVPLYRLFCQVTGYGGIPQRAERAPDQVLDRTVRIRFDANVATGLPWSFEPVQQVMDVKIGEQALAFYKATNNGTIPVTGTAIFNVAPEIAGRYFTKIECFCFKQQTLTAGTSVEMPVIFFVDPKIVEDENTKNISEITLSYTFYRSDAQPGIAVVPERDKSDSRS
ncbi:MAG TPA: cytochrome c oxidase assembly protein [Methyloceanibacter sp.]|nr:cytochrome c oxidase assembly protein [Methyloceanibacter sp.]